MHLFVGSPDDKKGTAGGTDEATAATGEASDRRFCSACRCSFESREDQVPQFHTKLPFI